MIQIRMDTKRTKLTVKGHAMPKESDGYAEICNAVGALAQSLMYSITLYGDANKGIKSIQYRDDPGDLLLLVIPEEWAKLVIRQRFKIYGDGMELMAKSHPQCVEMIRDGRKILPEEDER